MSNLTDWKNTKYDEVFEQESLALRRRRDLGCSIQDIEAVLKNIYHMEGSDIEGRSEVVQISMSASIAAHESFIAQWKAEKT